MKEVLKKVSCDPTCGFSVQSHDEKELMHIVKDHASHAHKMTMSDGEIRKKMVTI